MSTKLYAHWTKCIREKCPYAKNGKCNHPLSNEYGESYIRDIDFSSSGRCHHPRFQPYSEGIEALGAYENDTDEPFSDLPF
jgi:hypothetical protein